jgi:Zn-dependent peptidase ImmA (M78 family)
MPHSIMALANPKLLRWARESAGFELPEAARKLKVARSEDRLRAWESGEANPTIAQLRRLAEIYKRALAVFYLPDVPPELPPPRDLRRLPSQRRREFSPALRLLIRRVREQQEWARDLQEESEANPPAFVGSASLEDGVESVASKARSVLGVRVEDQAQWSATDDVLRDWIDACESIGVFVFQSGDVDVDEMRGLALLDKMAPAILLNAKDSRTARVFTLMHELAHILLAEEGISNLNLPETPRTREDIIEVFCNAVAAETLVPASHLRQQLAATGQVDIESLIESLRRLYRVSREVIARRLHTIGVISKQEYEQKRARYQHEYEEYAKRTSDSYPSYYRTRVSQNGRAFTALVLSAYWDGRITASDLSNLLKIKLRHVPKIELEVFPFRMARGAG